jgi:hypothetical protein
MWYFMPEDRTDYDTFQTVCSSQYKILYGRESGFSKTKYYYCSLLTPLWMMDGDECGAISGMDEWHGKPQYLEKTCPSAVLYTTHPT